MADPAVQGMRRFEGKGMIITGGGSGIGLATARRFLAEGARVLVADRNEAALRAAFPEQAGEAPVRTRVMDVSDAASVTAMVEAARAWLPRLDVLINNAGIATPERFFEISAVVITAQAADMR